jgi:hypothetical protein
VISGILGQVTGQLERRFVLNAFFPTMLFSLLIGVVVSSSTGGVTDAVHRWEEESTAVRVLVVIGWTAAVLVGANLVANATFWIIQLFEGYVGPSRWFSRWARRYQLRRAKSPKAIPTRYPAHKPAAKLGWRDVAPTTLGNVLKSAETYPEGRYGVQAVRVWPRLYHLLPEDLRASLADARSSMEFLLVISFYGATFAPLATVYLLVAEVSLPWTLAALLGGSVVAYLAYRGAHAPAEIYGDHVRAAFDLHRLDLLTAVGAPLPATNDEERRIWSDVMRFLDAGQPQQWRRVAAE